MRGEVEIDFADDLEQYLQAWNSTMKNHYWYLQSPVFDFNKDEEIDEIRSDFGTPGNLFLVARKTDNRRIIGVLGLRYRDIMARIRRWEPAVIPENQVSETATLLLERAFEHLRSIGVKRVGLLMKHPFDSPQLVKDLRKVFDTVGFENNRPDSVDLVMPLNTLKVTEAPRGVVLDSGENYTFEDLATITVKSFTSTPEEREIHGFDRTVTDHIQATALIQRMADGFYGPSPDNFRKIAIADGGPAGFLGAFVSKSKHNPLIGVLGPMAVLPEFRRRGIATYLVSAVLKELKIYGCEFAAVGTPAANTGAINMYQRCGFRLACRLVSLEREL